MKIPATVITGFLGAGKTTLIRSMLERANGRRIALIINEFGDLGVDRGLLAGCGIEGCADDDIIELANGCICCTVADDFLPVMEKLVGRKDAPDHIVIETSGLALPKPLIKAFNWPEVKSKVTVDGVVAVVDGPAFAAGLFADDPEAIAAQRAADPAFDHDNPLEEVFIDQVMAADLVLLNKADLMDGPGRAAAVADLATRLRPGVGIVETVRGDTDLRVLLGLHAAAEDDLASRPSHHDGAVDDHDHDDFDTFAFKFGTVTEPASLETALARTIAEHRILRVKGFIHVVGKPLRHVVQAAGPRIERYFDRLWGVGEAQESHLVFIAEKGFDRDAVEAAMRAAVGD